MHAFLTTKHSCYPFQSNHIPPVSEKKPNRGRNVKHKRIIALALVLALFGALALMIHLWIGDGRVQAGGVIEHEQVTVMPGDTLWSISRQQVEPNEDIRGYIQKLIRLNGLKGADIHSGQVLLLP